MHTRSFGALGAVVAMLAVGTGITVSAELVEYPVFGAQAVRYVAAAAILVCAVWLFRRPLPRPRGRDWAWLIGVAATGLVLFNVAVIRSVEHAEPAAVAILVSAVPLLLLVGESIRLRHRPSGRLLAGVVLVVVGAALVQGGGRTTVEGLAWALVALACEAAFTLLAVPVLGRLGAIGVSIHTCWIGAALFGALAVLVDGPGALSPMPTTAIAALAYLAVVQTAIAFSLWYSAVHILGAAVAGLFVGLMPVGAAVSGLVPGLTTVTPAVIGGSILVGVGIAVGLSARLLRAEPAPAAEEPVPAETRPAPFEGGAS
jgi:drug/metabolite transporter (DMT)-like permease